jgi:hypothetical protein
MLGIFRFVPGSPFDFAPILSLTLSKRHEKIHVYHSGTGGVVEKEQIGNKKGGPERKKAPSELPCEIHDENQYQESFACPER